MDSLAVGGALALLLRGPRPEFWLRLARIVLIPLWLLLAIMGFCEKGLDEFNPVTIVFGYSLLAFASAALIAESLRPASWISRFFSNPVLRFYGKISYGMYIYHLLVWRAAKPTFFFLASHLPSQTLAGIGVYVLFLSGTTIFSYLSFRFYEMPFLRLKDKLAADPALRAPSQSRQLPYTDLLRLHQDADRRDRGAGPGGAE
jgi:peptidoglycan/LPS O-acetylase OafA/YrhL